LRRTAGDRNPVDKSPDQTDKSHDDDRPVIKRNPGGK